LKRHAIAHKKTPNITTENDSHTLLIIIITTTTYNGKVTMIYIVHFQQLHMRAISITRQQPTNLHVLDIKNDANPTKKRKLESYTHVRYTIANRHTKKKD